MRLEADLAGLIGVSWLPPGLPVDGAGVPCLALERGRAAIRTYLENPVAPRPSVPLGEVPATAFQRRVWRLMLAIPAGTVRTYADLARDLGTSPRAVGGAARANPLPVLVPCHRVVGGADMGGYGGRGPRGRMVKQWLLAHEGCQLAGTSA